MKKIITALLLGSFAVGAFAEDDNVVTATYGNATGNTTRTMTIALNHEKDYVAFKLTLDLPEGTTVTGVTAKSPLKNDKTVDLSEVGGTATESTDFKVSHNQVGTKCCVLGYNLGNEKIAGKSGEILLTVTLQTAEGVAFDADGIACTYRFAGLSGEKLENNAVPVTDYRLWGDVVKDGVIDSKDYQTLANIVAGKTHDTSADMFAADMVQDDIYNAQDYQSLANKIAGK